MSSSLSGKKIAWTVGIVVLIAALAVASYMFFKNDSLVKYSEQDGFLIISSDAYEVSFDATNGGIAYIVDKQSSEKLITGNREGNLWWAFMEDESSHKATVPGTFTHSWDRSAKQLTLQYESPFTVKVVADFSQVGRFTMQASVHNQTESTVQSFRFPYEMRFDSSLVVDALLPMMPGAKLKSTFFTENNSFEGQYPGVMFASYAALQSKSGNVAVYDVNAIPIVSADVGFKSQVDQADVSAIVHNYKTWIAPDAKWESPVVVVQVGADYENSIASYRARNKIDQYASLNSKLGQLRQQYAESPLLKLDIAAIGRENWNSLKTKWVDKLHIPGIVHLVGFQDGGHDENYPDFVPPAEKWGGMNAFKDFVAYAHERGNLAVPYTNFSWWGVHAPTLANLPSGMTLEDIVVKAKNGFIMKEDYGPHSGYVMNPNEPFVMERIAREHDKLVADVGFDGVFEDQWGARNAPYMHNDKLPDGTDVSNAYFEGVRRYFAALSIPMFNEVGIDVLADKSVGFLGTNYLWDVLGYRTKTDKYTEYYPMAGMLLRDKVMLYQHNLALETMTHSKEMLRWNMAQGYNLSADLQNGADHLWVDVAGVFQKQLLSRYPDQLVGRYVRGDDGSSVTEIGDYTIVANWQDDAVFMVDDRFSLSPGGVQSVNKDESLRGGVYARYNGIDLDPGDHYLVEVREADKVRLFQPNGSDTTVGVRKGDGWAHATATAYRYDGTKVSDMPVIEQDDRIVFDYVGMIDGGKIGYVQIDRSESPSLVKDVPFNKQIPLVNLAAGKPIVSSTDTSKDYPAVKGNDGDPFTYWESMPKRFPQSITVDLEAVMEMKKIVLTVPPLDVWGARDQEIEIQVSNDGNDFTTVVAADRYRYDPATGNRVEIDVDAKSRFVRVVISDNTGWPAAQVSEFEIY